MPNTPRAKNRKERRGKEQVAGIYVDELQPPAARRKELISILQNYNLSKDRFASIIIYGSLQSDVDEQVKAAISTVEEHGIKVKFAR